MNDKLKELDQLSKEFNQAKNEANSTKSTLKVAQGKLSEQYSELRVHLLSQFMSLACSKCYKLLSNSKNLSQCFSKIADSTNIRGLNKKDKDKLRRTISQEIPKLIIDYSNRKEELDYVLRKLDKKTLITDKECEFNKLKHEYKDRFQKINIDRECGNKKRIRKQSL